MKPLPPKQSAALAIKAISMHIPECSEARLMVAVIASALNDIVTNPPARPRRSRFGKYKDFCSAKQRHGTALFVHAKNREGAIKYLNGYIHHAEVCGVDSSWVRSVIGRVGIRI